MIQGIAQNVVKNLTMRRILNLMIYEYREGMSLEEQKNGAYWERNMLALHFADGWYHDTDNNWEGWKRVVGVG